MPKIILSYNHEVKQYLNKEWFHKNETWQVKFSLFEKSCILIPDKIPRRIFTSEADEKFINYITDYERQAWKLDNPSVETVITSDESPIPDHSTDQPISQPINHTIDNEEENYDGESDSEEIPNTEPPVNDTTSQHSSEASNETTDNISDDKPNEVTEEIIEDQEDTENTSDAEINQSKSSTMTSDNNEPSIENNSEVNLSSEENIQTSDKNIQQVSSDQSEEIIDLTPIPINQSITDHSSKKVEKDNNLHNAEEALIRLIGQRKT